MLNCLVLEFYALFPCHNVFEFNALFPCCISLQCRLLTPGMLMLQGFQGQPHGRNDDAESQEDEVQR